MNKDTDNEGTEPVAPFKEIMPPKPVFPGRATRLLMGTVLLALTVVIVGLYASASAKKSNQEFPVGRPPLSPGIFPCSSCHEGMETNTEKRTLTEHTDIKLRHAPEALSWCFSCHDTKDRDKLRLINGDIISFTETYRLCGQCHGTNYRDWKAGIHGKRVGYFDNGPRQYFLCVACHNPHDPKFKPLKPEAPPFKPLDKGNG